MKKIAGDLHETDISGIYSTEMGSFKVKQIGTMFFIRYRKENSPVRNSPWLCSLSGIGGMSCHRKSKQIFLQIFLGITDPISVIELFLLTMVVLGVVSWKIISISFLMLVSVIITICVAVLTFCATALSGTWKDEKKAIERIIKGLFEQQS